MTPDATRVPPWRSFLFVPVLNDRFIDGAPGRGADVIQLDLEDAIPPDQKDAARARVAQVADTLAARGCDVIVRINRPWRMALPDIEAAVCPAVLALTLPKVPHAQHVRSVAEVVDELERERGMTPGSTRFVAMIETAEGLNNVQAIAAADPRVCGVIVGAEDLAVSMGMRPTPAALRLANLQTLQAARAAGCAPLGFVGSLADFSDLDDFREKIREARELGFVGAFAIHPAQVPILNTEFSPGVAEIERAEALVAAFEQSIAEGHGAFAFEGKMVDLPVVEQARAVLSQRDAIAARQTR
ncbi:HpcH/HpaI aldolase/citrate lyase family protein [Meridianimarinicoccus sp. RP-17]|uniref:HpcH/HpaI aldolase/citrate lyase family protein n=1 Tax=Meridianimarinicoccus zhengii TaxID=2056810 RepID=UPI000DACA622|nr:CoA ester lyase [Phycocomes zhengii]